MLAVIAVCGGYDGVALRAGVDEYRRLLNATFVDRALVGIACYLLRLSTLDRDFFVLAPRSPAAPWCAAAAARAPHRRQSLRRRGLLLHRVLIVGERRPHVDEVAEVLERHESGSATTSSAP